MGGWLVWGQSSRSGVLLCHAGEVAQCHVELLGGHGRPQILDEIVGGVAVVVCHEQGADLLGDGLALEGGQGHGSFRFDAVSLQAAPLSGGR